MALTSSHDEELLKMCKFGHAHSASQAPNDSTEKAIKSIEESRISSARWSNLMRADQRFLCAAQPSFAILAPESERDKRNFVCQSQLKEQKNIKL